MLPPQGRVALRGRVREREAQLAVGAFSSDGGERRLEEALLLGALLPARGRAAERTHTAHARRQLQRLPCLEIDTKRRSSAVRARGSAAILHGGLVRETERERALQVLGGGSLSDVSAGGDGLLEPLEELGQGLRRDKRGDAAAAVGDCSFAWSLSPKEGAPPI